MDQDPETRQAAWVLYVGLHGLAESQTFGQVISDTRRATPPGDIDDLLHQLERNQTVLDCARPGLGRRIRDAVTSWDERPADRLAALLPLLDDLAEITGTSLPLPLPPLP
ncbi:hypothetical protein [Streptomyces sp. 4F14]|uniref:hypothetical protein n=1 Tax=Streptomyces sp. 4F14 TaxID=3394380 RepID=UPI003A8AC47C